MQQNGVFCVVRAAFIAMQRSCKHASTTIERLCFLRGPCRGVWQHCTRFHVDNLQRGRTDWVLQRIGSPPVEVEIPCTVMEVTCFEKTIELIHRYVLARPRNECTKVQKLVGTFTALYIAGVLCVIVSLALHWTRKRALLPLRLSRSLALLGYGRVLLSESLWLAHWQLLMGWCMMQWKSGYVCHCPYNLRSGTQ
jgi:hypothetical protein